MALRLEALSQTVDKAIRPLLPDASAQAAGPAAGEPAPPMNPARKVQQVGGAIMGTLGLPLQLMNAGAAAIAEAILPPAPHFPAATMGALYVGPPHCHGHPPSLVTPPTPIPLPSIGPVLLGTSFRVLIGGQPAARAGDLGLALTCGGFAPLFEIKTGSSKVFIGGMRAARMTDACQACFKTPGAPVRGVALAMKRAGQAMAVAGILADATDAATGSDPHMQMALAKAAAMGAVEAAADAAATAAAAAMGTDPIVPPSPPARGNLMTGNPKVLIGGYPFANFPDPVKWLLEKLETKITDRLRQNKEKGDAGCSSCPE